MSDFGTLADFTRIGLLDLERRLRRQFEETPDLSSLLPGAKGVGQRYLGMLHRAHRLSLSPEFTELAAGFSLLPPRDLLNAMQHVRMPFDTMFIEWNEQVRVRALSKRDPDAGVAELCGFLISRNTHPDWTSDPALDGPLYDVLVVARGADDADVSFFPVGFSLCPTFPDFFAQSASRMSGGAAPLMPGENAAEIDAATIMTLVGRGYTDAMSLRLLAETPAEIAGRRDDAMRLSKDIIALAGFGRVIAAGPVGDLIGSSLAVERLGVAAVRSYLERAANEINGDYRFLISVLALMNIRAVPTVSRPGRRGKARFARGKFIPSYEYKVLTLEAPVFSAQIAARDFVSTAPPRRWHTVKGAWHHSRRYGDPTCRHAYVREVDEKGAPIGSDRHICSLCGHKKWFVPAHGRGDRTLGILDKGYEIVPPGRKTGSRRLRRVSTQAPP